MNKTFIRVLALMVTLCICVCCAACGEQTSNDKGKPQNSISTPVVEGNSSTELQGNSSDNSQNASLNNSQNKPSNNSSNISSDTISYPEINDSNRLCYKPISATLSMYDTSNSSYGFTWNSEFEPVDPVIQICEGDTFKQSKCTEYKATVLTTTTYNPSITYLYVCKVDVKLKQNTTYSYRAYDKYAKIASSSATFKTGDLSASSFKFVHVSDSQVTGLGAENNYSGEGTGEYFSQTLQGILAGSPNFMVHTGDFVEYSKYEGYWKNMLDFNAQYIMKLPIMALSGNHETTYRNGSNETYKHFNHKIPTQDTTKGYYYSFTYGDVKFIMLNTNRTESSGLETAQYNWLVNELKNNKKKWTIVSMHNPMYSVGKYGSNPSNNSIALALRKQLSKLFADYKVDLVLQGHDHAYSKTYPIIDDGVADKNQTYETIGSVQYTVNPTGTIYSMHGPAGNQSRSKDSNADLSLYEIAASSKTNSWAEISIEDNRLTVHIKYYANNNALTAYSYGIIKK